MAANAFTSTFSPESFVELILNSEVFPILCIYNTQQNIDKSFFIRGGSNGKLKIEQFIYKSKYRNKKRMVFAYIHA
jgi:hypothetical protein